MNAEPQNEAPDHLREAAQAIDELRAQRHRQMPRAERAVQRLVESIGRPRFILALAIGLAAWAFLSDHSFTALDTFAQLASFLLVVAILSHQNTESTIEQERARLMLQLMMIQDRKVTQALNAIEDLRREHPRIDTSGDSKELHQETDLHQAARALREAEKDEPAG
ncbi:MAG: hypothetical protein ABR508_11125 [Candidatus Baltobacteraceae bacterium]